MATAEIKSKASLDATQFNRGINGMKQSVSGFASGSMKQLGGMIAGAFAVGSVVNFAKNTLEAAQSLTEFSNNTNVNVERLQALRLVAERSGSSMEHMDTSLSRIYKAQAEAAGGNKNIIESFKRLGLSVDQVQSMQPDQMFEAISKATLNVGAASEETAAAGTILGKGYVALNNTMNEVATGGLQNITDKLKENNEIMSNEAVNSAAIMQESYERLANSMKVTFGNVVIDFLGGLKVMALNYDNWVIRMVNPLRKMMGKEELKQTDVAMATFGDLSNKGGRKQAGSTATTAKTLKDTLNLKVEAADSLGKIGGVMGGQTDPMLNAIQAQMRLLEEIEKNTSKAADQAQATAANTGSMAE
jgi:hypothetical protein